MTVWQKIQAFVFAVPITMWFGFWSVLGIGFGVLGLARMLIDPDYQTNISGLFLTLFLGLAGLVSIVGGWIFVFKYQRVLQVFSKLSLILIVMLLPALFIVSYFVLNLTVSSGIAFEFFYLYKLLMLAVWFYVLHCYIVLVLPLFKSHEKL